MRVWLLAIGMVAAGPDLPTAGRPPDASARALATSWQNMSSLLRVRPFLLTTLDPKLAEKVRAGIGQVPTQGLRFSVVVDTPETVGLVGPAMAASWDKSEAEIYAVARAHTRVALQADLQQTQLVLPGRSGTAIPGELWTGPDAASTLADLDSFLGPALRGALLAVPSRDTVFVHRLSPEDNLDNVLATFSALAVAGATPDAEPFSTAVFWFGEDHLRLLPVHDPPDGPPRVLDSVELSTLRASLSAPAGR